MVQPALHCREEEIRLGILWIARDRLLCRVLCLLQLPGFVQRLGIEDLDVAIVGVFPGSRYFRRFLRLVDLEIGRGKS